MVKVLDFSDSDDGDSSDSSIDIDQTQNVSMAASAAYIPGASLSDKLRLAASKGQVEKIHKLINAGATFQPDREGRTALHYAALSGQGEIVQILADEGADINGQDSLGYTALHRAAAQGHLEVVKVLLVEACVVDRQDEVHGCSPLHEAAWNGYSKTLEMLIRHKANVHCVNKAGFTALHLAAQNGHNQSARVLLYANCNADVRNNYGDTALHTAGRYGHAGVTRILISARCNISEQNKNGDSALHIAAALKRRKLTKLLVESKCDISLRNKQNETAVEVARRKAHTDIVLIISSQTKNGKKSKKDKKKKDKGSKMALNGGEEPEKKGFFFKRKSKSKDKENEKKRITEGGIPDCPLSAPSEASSSEFTSHLAPEEILRESRPHPRPHPPRREPGYHGHGHNQGSNARGTSTGRERRDGKDKVKGLLTEYSARTGTQYYKDLAGNVRQGPIGFTPVCNCQPVLKKMEKRMESDRNNLYDQIDSSRRALVTRIETLDHRTTQQFKTTEEQLEAERRERENFVRSCVRKDRMETQHDCEHRHSEMKHQLQDHMDDRFTNFEKYYELTAVKTNDPYYRGNAHRVGPAYHQDDLLNQRNVVYGAAEPPMPGRLFRSRSDETLSVASSHPSRRHWKLRSNTTKDVLDMKLARVNDKARRIERRLCSKSSGVNARAPSTEHLNKPKSVQVQRNGHMPDGNSGSNLHSHPEYQSYKDHVEQQHQWNAKRNPIDMGMTQHFEQHQPPAQDNYGSLRRSKPDVHAQQATRPRSASNNSAPQQNGHCAQQYMGSTRELYDKENPRPRSTSRTRPNSKSRAPDGAPSTRSFSQSPLSEPNQSQFPMGGNSGMQYPGKNIPHSASYDSSMSQHQQQPPRQQRHNNSTGSTTRSSISNESSWSPVKYNREPMVRRPMGNPHQPMHQQGRPPQMTQRQWYDANRKPAPDTWHNANQMWPAPTAQRRPMQTQNVQYQSPNDCGIIGKATQV